MAEQGGKILLQVRLLMKKLYIKSRIRVWGGGAWSYAPSFPGVEKADTQPKIPKNPHERIHTTRLPEVAEMHLTPPPMVCRGGVVPRDPTGPMTHMPSILRPKLDSSA